MERTARGGHPKRQRPPSRQAASSRNAAAPLLLKTVQSKHKSSKYKSRLLKQVSTDSQETLAESLKAHVELKSRKLETELSNLYQTVIDLNFFLQNVEQTFMALRGRLNILNENCDKIRSDPSILNCIEEYKITILQTPSQVSEPVCYLMAVQFLLVEERAQMH
jgi:hypothetical protein